MGVHIPSEHPARAVDRDVGRLSTSDVDILNLALTLEHLENALYTEGLSRFTQKDFVDAGFPDWSYGRFQQIAAHEAAHVHLLEATLGDKAAKPCTYKLYVVGPRSDARG